MAVSLTEEVLRPVTIPVHTMISLLMAAKSLHPARAEGCANASVQGGDVIYRGQESP
jgi:hypothetical protein